MNTFRRLFIVAGLAGLISGLFITLVHQVSTSQLILAAEVYEKAAEAQAAPVAEATTAADMTVAATEADGHDHDHGAAAWEPEDGFQRILLTAIADILIGIAFSLLLVAGYRIWGGETTWRTGLYWGFAGFAAIVLSPGLGLPPEVPGTEAAPLLDRQIWWIATAVLTAGGIGMIFFGRRYWWAALGLALIVLPHAYGAPQPADAMSVAPEALAHRFVVAATIAGLLSWAVLGTTTGYFYSRVFKDAAA